MCEIAPEAILHYLRTYLGYVIRVIYDFPYVTMTVHYTTIVIPLGFRPRGVWNKQTRIWSLFPFPTLPFLEDPLATLSGTNLQKPLNPAS